jgi:hypothetical protein
MQVPDGSSFDEFNARTSILEMVREGATLSGLAPAMSGDDKYLSDMANRLLGWNGRDGNYVSCQNKP